MRQHPADQRRRRRLAVRAGDDDRARAPEELLADRFRQRAVADLAVQHRLELGVAARDRVADHHQIEFAGDVLGVVAVERADALLLRGTCSSADRRPDPIRARPSPVRFSIAATRRHRRAADADEMNAMHMEALGLRSTRRRRSSITDRFVAAGAAVTRRADAERQRHGRARRCDPRAGPATTGPGKSRRTSRTHRRAPSQPGRRARRSRAAR